MGGGIRSEQTKKRYVTSQHLGVSIRNQYHPITFHRDRRRQGRQPERAAAHNDHRKHEVRRPHHHRSTRLEDCQESRETSTAEEDGEFLDGEGRADGLLSIIRKFNKNCLSKGKRVARFFYI